MLAFLAPASLKPTPHNIIPSISNQSPRHRLSSHSRSRQTIHASLSDLLIVGANRGLGYELASELSDKATNLTATFNTYCPPTLAAIATVHRLDAMDIETVNKLITNVVPHTIISCIGGSVEKGEYPDNQGNKNLIDAAIQAGVKRFIMISALGAGDSEGSVPFQVMDTMRPLLLEKSHAEVYLRGKQLQSVILRPGPLVDGEPSGNAVTTEGTKCYGTVSRKDMAKVIVQVLQTDKAIGKTLHVVDTKNILITSPYVRPLEFWEPLPFEEFAL